MMAKRYFLWRLLLVVWTLIGAAYSAIFGWGLLVTLTSPSAALLLVFLGGLVLGIFIVAISIRDFLQDGHVSTLLITLSAPIALYSLSYIFMVGKEYGILPFNLMVSVCIIWTLSTASRFFLLRQWRQKGPIR